MASTAEMQELKKWLDWTYGTIAAQRWDDAKWNLNQFWALALSLDTSGNDDQQAQILSWEARAKIAESLLKMHEGGEAESTLIAPFVPDTTKATVTQKTQESIDAADIAAKLAQEAISRGSKDILAKKQADIQAKESRNESKTLRKDVPNAVGDFLSQSVLGVPVWAFAVGAVGLGLYLRSK